MEIADLSGENKLNNLRFYKETVMAFVFMLKHIYKFTDSKGYEQFEDKFLGIYSCERKVNEAIERYFVLSGFNQHPRECFVIERWEIDQDTSWKEGFIKSFEANKIKKIAEKYDENTGGFDVSSWLFGKMPIINESPMEFANRLMTEKYGENNWNLDEGLREEYNDLILWGEICFE